GPGEDARRHVTRRARGFDEKDHVTAFRKVDMRHIGREQHGGALDRLGSDPKGKCTANREGELQGVVRVGLGAVPDIRRAWDIERPEAGALPQHGSATAYPFHGPGYHEHSRRAPPWSTDR